MRFLISFFLVFYTLIHLNAQRVIQKSEQNYMINFKTTYEPFLETRKNDLKELDFFYSTEESKPGFPKLPSKTFYLAIPPFSQIEVSLQNPFYTVLNKILVKANPQVDVVDDSILNYREVDLNSQIFTDEFYPSKEIEVIGYTWIRDFYVAAITVNNYRYSLARKELIILDSTLISIKILERTQEAFVHNSNPLSIYDDQVLKSVIINFEDALPYRSVNTEKIYSDSTGNWIDYSKEYLKFSIPFDNIYRVTYNDLISYGVNASQIHPRTFKLFWKGKEQPIYVYGEDDNSFDSTDFIEFYAEKNYTYQDHRKIVQKGEDYIQFMDRYSDTTIVWLTWDGQFGKRVSLLNENPISTSNTISSHLVKLHFEQDKRLWYYDATLARVQLPFWQENKTFTWLVIGNSGSTSINFIAKDFVQNSPVKVISRLISYAAGGGTNAHRHGLSLNKTTPQDTITYDYKKTVNLIGNYYSSSLVDGNNTIRIFGIPGQSSFHQSLIDWLDVEYYRRNVAVNDTLKLIIPDTVQKDLRIVKIENITNPAALVLYKINPDLKKITQFVVTGLNPYTIYFIDSVGGGDQYYITTLSKISKPFLKNKKYFVNLRSASRGADYILITNKILQTSTNLYKDFISNNYNLRVELIYDEDIFDEFSYGMPQAEAIKLFLISAYSSWIPPKPSFLTLIGDANYDYKDVVTPAPNPRKKNLLISYGNPVSDIWYVMWDTANVHFPQMFVGRIPANNDDQVLIYLQKHQKYLQRRFDKFNKSYIFFSGGDATKPSELAQIIATNDYIMNSYIKSSPIYGNAFHFYKTISPPSNFGPYSLEFVQSVINEGGLYISYIGHSGTRTWDNSITEVEHIKNKYSDRFPLITDFGCSTGKFAEPDVDAFGELFVCQSPNGQSIAYLGNSSWGYLSTSLRFPKYFYENLTKDSLKGIGRAHLLSKIRQLNETGINDVNLVFTYCNLMFGDPIIGLQIPKKPNFQIDESKIQLLTTTPNDQMDSIKFQVVISNLGIVNTDSVEVYYEEIYQDSVILTNHLKIPFIKFQDTLVISVPVGNFIGNRLFKFTIDPLNAIDEIYEDDNVAQINYVVNSTSLTPIEVSDYFNTYRNFIEVLNPIFKNPSLPERLILEISPTKDFNQPRIFIKDFDSLITKVELQNLIMGQRYFYRTKIDDPMAYWSKTYSYFQGRSEFTLLFNDFGEQRNSFELFQTIFDSSTNSWKLSKTPTSLKIISAGGHDGAFGSIQWNGYEQLPNTYYWGIATAIIDSITLKPSSTKYFNVPDPGVSDSLSNYINQLPTGTLLAMTISADAVQNVLSNSARNSIKSLGSLYIDSVKYRESWCILGKKGASIGSVLEDYKKLFAGVAQIEITKNLTYDSGYVVFPEMKFSGKWNYLKAETFRPTNSNIIFIPLGIRSDRQIDTLFHLQTSLDSINLSSIDAKVYPSLKILAKLYANSQNESPMILSLGANYQPVAELAINYQTVSVDKDTIIQGETINYYAKIFNAGKSDADSFKVQLELIRSDNSNVKLIDTVISKLPIHSAFNLFYQYVNKIYDGFGNFSFKLTINPGNSVNEFFEENNTFYKSFFVKKDTTTSISEASVSVLFNGREIRDWEYVEPDARIEIRIDYPIWFPVTDTSAVQIFLDGQRYYNEHLFYTFDSVRRQIHILFETDLSKGEHNLKVYLKDAFGRIPIHPTIDKYFKVTSDLEILQVYNYPNPFSSFTYFTFILTQIPDELQIKIYTVAGRLIKELKLTSSELLTNFNRIYWDGRDEDGDFLGNGVYLYKVVAKKHDKIITRNQKLAVVR